MESINRLINEKRQIQISTGRMKNQMGGLLKKLDDKGKSKIVDELRREVDNCKREVKKLKESEHLKNVERDLLKVRFENSQGGVYKQKHVQQISDDKVGRHLDVEIAKSTSDLKRTRDDVAKKEGELEEAKTKYDLLLGKTKVVVHEEINFSAVVTASRLSVLKSVTIFRMWSAA